MQRITEGEYKLPDGCICVFDRGSGTIEIKKRGFRKARGLRCRECKYFGYGNVTYFNKKNKIRTSTACLNHSKFNKDGEDFYQYVSKYNMACKDFKPVEKDETDN